MSSNDPVMTEVFAAVAARFPDRPAILHGDRATSYGSLAENANRLANFLLAAGMGLKRERGDLAPWESGQTHVGLLMYNCAQYLEAEIATATARAVAINVNYRYVSEELIYLFRDASLRALVFHSSCAAQVAAVLTECPGLTVLVQVPDALDVDLLPGAIWYADALAQGAPNAPNLRPSPDDLHILYTGGTTGKPKGVMWRQADILITGLGGRHPDGRENRLSDYLHSAERSASRTLPAGPFMHASGRWIAISQLMLGNVVVLPNNTRRFDPADIWQTVVRERVSGLNIVGDAMAQPLLAELGNVSYDLSSLRMISSGAAVLSQASKRALLERLPHIRISDTVGSSETGPQASTILGTSDAGESTRFTAAAGTTILNEDLSAPLDPASSEVGWLARSGRMPLGYLGDAVKTAKAFRAVCGVRYAVPGDRARWSADGRICLLGRDSSTINTGGEKVFAEEVEMALKHHAAIEDAVVCGRPSERWGQEIVAVVALREDVTAERSALIEECAKHVARYKLPKEIVFVANVLRSASGKPDYDWARRVSTATELQQEEIS